MNVRLFVLLCITWIFAARNVQAQSSPKIDFNFEILPILSRACFSCHGPDEKSRQAELRLDIPDGLFHARKRLIEPNNPSASLVIQRITSLDVEQRMPPAESKQQLTSVEIELIRRWIDEGATWSEHWSYQPITQHLPPDVKNNFWCREPIDNFILFCLEQRRLVPSDEATKETLLRRTSLDLTGLPPTRSQRDEFLTERTPDAYERLVDRLLASPHFGERWGRFWLDAARYADSGGFEGDPPRSIWKYRDWVINAMNQDLPFDEFVMKQLAGHLLPDGSDDDRIATGFLLNSQQDGGSEPARIDAVIDRVNTMGTVFLGLTVGCAQCHSHKFDSLTQREYYALLAFINSADELKLEFASAQEIAQRDALAAQIAALNAEQMTYSSSMTSEMKKNDPGFLERTKSIEVLQKRIPEFISTLVLQPAPPNRVTTTFIRGEFAQPGEAVAPNVPGALPPLRTSGSSLLDLAKWLVSPEQPLTARVTVNRIWQQLFGRGLVETENDFGTQGARPTHPELLDCLAIEYSKRGWSTKRLLRRILGSTTYRQSSFRRNDLERIDPENHWLGRQSRLRLEAEIIRDSALAVSELLSVKIGGPGVFPFQQEGIMINRATPATWTLSPGEDRYRRGIYTHYWRLTPHPQLQTFDAPDSITACTRRLTSNTPLQALTLLNDPTFVEVAESLARQLVEGRENRDDQRLKIAFETCLSREPSIDERNILLRQLNIARSRLKQRATESIKSTSAIEISAWQQLTRTIVNLEEFIVRE